MLVATWGEWRRFAAVGGRTATLVPFNAWVTLSLCHDATSKQRSSFAPP